jgi:hypothetical protein
MKSGLSKTVFFYVHKIDFKGGCWGKTCAKGPRGIWSHRATTRAAIASGWRMDVIIAVTNMQKTKNVADLYG